MALNPYIAQAKEDAGINPNVAFSELTWDEQQRYKLRLAQLTVAHREEFSAEAIATAQKILALGSQPAPESYGITDALSDFSAGVAEQAEEINPLSEQNRGKLAVWIGLIVLAGVVAFAAVKGGFGRKKADL